MNTGSRNSVADVSGAPAVLLELCRPFAPSDVSSDCEAVLPENIPMPQHALLVHRNHMTVELERYYGKPVELQVLGEHRDGDHYTRKIGLNLAGAKRAVEWGICRLNLRYLSNAVREEVLAKQSPLGAILIRHNVYRRIEPQLFIRLPAYSPMIALFSAAPNPAPVFGRIGIIYCNDEPAIEVLEIVINSEAKNSL